MISGIIQSKSFNGAECDFYVNGESEMLMSSHQIGRALGYENPTEAVKAVEAIHDANRKRLDKLSRRYGYVATDGEHCVVVFYTERGIYEVARLCQQPKAHQFFDFVYDEMSAIRKERGESFGF